MGNIYEGKYLQKRATFLTKRPNAWAITNLQRKLLTNEGKPRAPSCGSSATVQHRKAKHKPNALFLLLTDQCLPVGNHCVGFAPLLDVAVHCKEGTIHSFERSEFKNANMTRVRAVECCCFRFFQDIIFLRRSWLVQIHTPAKVRCDFF